MADWNLDNFIASLPKPPGSAVEHARVFDGPLDDAVALVGSTLTILRAHLTDSSRDVSILGALVMPEQAESLLHDATQPEGS